MSESKLSQLRNKVLPFLAALDQEVVQPGLTVAEGTMRRVVDDLACPAKESWLRGAHRHMALHSALQRFASLQSGWTRFVFNNVPFYQIDNDLCLTVKRTPQGRKASRAAFPFDPAPFELYGFDQQTIFPIQVVAAPVIANMIALDYVMRSDGQRLTALLLRRDRKRFDPLCCVAARPALRLVPASLDPVAGPPLPVVRSRIKRAQNDMPR